MTAPKPIETTLTFNAENWHDGEVTVTFTESDTEIRFMHHDNMIIMRREDAPMNGWQNTEYADDPHYFMTWNVYLDDGSDEKMFSVNKFLKDTRWATITGYCDRDHAHPGVCAALHLFSTF